MKNVEPSQNLIDQVHDTPAFQIMVTRWYILKNSVHRSLGQIKETEKKPTTSPQDFFIY